MKRGFQKKILACALSFMMFLSSVSFRPVHAEENLELKLNPSDINTGFLEYVQNRNAQTSLTGSKALGYKPSAFIFQKDYSEPKFKLFFKKLNKSLPSEYNSNTVGLVTSIKDQGNFGSCWAFGATAALESSYLKSRGLSVDSLKDDPVDFSEMNMVYNLNSHATINNPYDFDIDEGGSTGMIAAYYSRGNGAVLEDDDPYQSGFDKSETYWKVKKRTYSDTKNKIQDKYVRELIFIPDPDSNDKSSKEKHIDLVKKFIMDCGSIASAIYFDEEYMSQDDKNYYYDGAGDSCECPNHLINIVGWDDNYSKENFKFTPENNGAFIVKNSWGTSYHDKGYFYLSYEDVFAGADSIAITEIDNSQEKYLFDNIYQRDYFGMQLAIPTGQYEITQCKVFDLRDQREKLTDVGLFTANNNVYCEFYLARLDSTGKPVDLGPKLGEKYFELPGYHTVELESNVELNRANNNGKFGIAIKMSADETINLPVEASSSLLGTSKAKGYEKENFIRLADKFWDVHLNIGAGDLSFGITNLNIKAFTEKI